MPDQKEVLLEEFHTRPWVTLLIPTKDESENILPLLDRIGKAMKNTPFQVSFIDDSQDGTALVIQNARSNFKTQISLITRSPGERSNGLSGAIFEGLKSAYSNWVCVMDADLQHPPEVIPQLIDKAIRTGADIVVGSRFATSEGITSLGKFRSRVSRLFTSLIRLLFPKRLKNVTDPLSGIFLLRRKAIEIDRLHPIGFKILLEILIRNPDLHVEEIPYTIDSRHSGQSKASIRVGLQLFQQLLFLRLAGFQHFIRFLVVGASGLLVNSVVMALLTEGFQTHYLLSASFATQISTLWNFGFTNIWVYGDRKDLQPFWERILNYFVMNNAFLFLRGPLIVFLTSTLSIHYLVSNFISIAGMTLVRYLVSEFWIWKKPSITNVRLPFLYDIHGIIKIESAKRLPELEKFHSPFLGQADMRLTIGILPEEQPFNGSLRYIELFKNVGFGIEIKPGGLTDVTATPLLGKSPHVLYTNVVEPLLRWNLVRKGYTLFHGACISHQGEGMIITARTDTGKTTTILKSLRDNSYSFLSDDMTILSPQGQVMSFPKPLTISHHTLQALDQPALSLKERLFLIIQSRLHSRGGRWIGQWMARIGLPAATLNAVVQIIIPPPKFQVNRLVKDVNVDQWANLTRIVIIERGENNVKTISPTEALSILVENNEDAYAFPPYPQIAVGLSCWKGRDLHEAELEIISKAIANCSVFNISSSSYDWCSYLPEIWQTHQVPNQNIESQKIPQPVNICD